MKAITRSFLIVAIAQLLAFGAFAGQQSAASLTGPKRSSTAPHAALATAAKTNPLPRQASASVEGPKRKTAGQIRSDKSVIARESEEKDGVGQEPHGPKQRRLSPRPRGPRGAVGQYSASQVGPKNAPSAMREGS